MFASESLRSAAALIDVSPLFKYEVSGPDALRLLNRVFTRDIARCAVGQVMYGPWCDDDGQVIDDGTVAPDPGADVPDVAPPGSCRMRHGEVTGIPVLACTQD